MDFELLRDRRVAIAAAAGAVALVAGLGVIVGLAVRGRHQPPPAAGSDSPHSLQVEMGKEDPGLEAKRPLRCFVGGQFVGMLTLSDCARKNGVAPGGLDVGVDPTGAVAAATGDSSVLQPLPGVPAPPTDAPAGAEVAASSALPASTATGACWRYSGDWRRVSDEMGLSACIQALFAGRCERPGAAEFGRWNSDTLRLVTGRVELSTDNRTFRPVAAQSPGDCAITGPQE